MVSVPAIIINLRKISLLSQITIIIINHFSKPIFEILNAAKICIAEIFNAAEILAGRNLYCRIFLNAAEIPIAEIFNATEILAGRNFQCSRNFSR